MYINLNGKTALITGATRGIGLAIARIFLSAGANLIVTGTRDSGKNLIFNQLPKLNDNQTIEYIAVDFNFRDSVDFFLNRLKLKEEIDICVNNAGTNCIKKISDISIYDIQKLHMVNLHVPFLIQSVVLEKMKQKRWGRVVNIGSLWSKLSREGRSLYSSSKYGLMGLTVTAALEYAPYNVLVNMVSPGFVLTDLSKAMLTPREMRDIENRIPIGRFAECEDIATPVLFLCSGANNYITGQNIIVDGGYICE